MNENIFLLHTFLLGVKITSLYDILRILRRVFTHGSGMVSLEDIAFWIYCAGEVFLLMFRESNGNLRWFGVLGALAGMYLYHRTISPITVKYIPMLINMLLNPIRRTLKKKLTDIRKMLNIFYKRRCAYGKKKSGLPQETPEPVQHVPGEPGRIDDHGSRSGAKRGITTED